MHKNLYPLLSRVAVGLSRRPDSRDIGHDTRRYETKSAPPAQRSAARAAQRSHFVSDSLVQVTEEMLGALTGCERILRTPLPPGYVGVLRLPVLRPPRHRARPGAYAPTLAPGRTTAALRALFVDDGAGGGGPLRAVPPMARPALGGLCCGAIGLAFPQVASPREAGAPPSATPNSPSLSLGFHGSLKGLP